MLSASELHRVRADIGFIHQDLALVPNLRVVQNVLAGRLGRISFLQALRDALFPSRDVVADVYTILERVGIP
ncbi:MAG TPA: phosphonate ABC transporter ATP-binding protein, partial [Thermoanaerobaculia bacterium]|nr:phosphonate ABC transporter ATP-binding protein [Thermoanaerobaculia bacterium]